MLADPPIDKLLEKTECRYMLACGVAKRARQLMQQNPEMFRDDKVKPLSVAAKEVYDGSVVIRKD
ncbi:MAG: DNA-directed RNA polymerase subunit omega [Clostridia bacterium]|nr:DNA-directed RNA polymerase subunit omega [Clostridia bacterium]